MEKSMPQAQFDSIRIEVLKTRYVGNLVLRCVSPEVDLVRINFYNGGILMWVFFKSVNGNKPKYNLSAVKHENDRREACWLILDQIGLSPYEVDGKAKLPDSDSWPDIAKFFFTILHQN